MEFLSPVLHSLLFCFQTPTYAPETSFEDARCKCVCPKFRKDANSTASDRTVFISSNADPNQW